MDLQHYRSLGRSGLRVSPLCLGTMTFGNDWNWGSDESESRAILEAYLSRGGNFLDTANGYTFGHSERILGGFFGSNRRLRHSVVLATKFFCNMWPGDPNAGGGSRKAMLRQCEESLKRLQTDYIDLYWLHCWDRHTPIEETMDALHDLVRQGKVHYIGFSDTPAWIASRAQTLARERGLTCINALQIEYSLIQRSVEGELMPMARELGMGVTPWSPLKGGLLTGKYRRGKELPEGGRSASMAAHLTERNYDIVERLITVSEEVGATPAQVALAWLLRQPGVTSPIIGARTMKQLEDNLGALTVELNDDHLHRLDLVSKPALPFPCEFVENARGFGYGGTTIDGVTSPEFALAPPKDHHRYLNE